MNRDDNVSMVDIPLRNEELAGGPLRRIRIGGSALVVGVQRAGEVLVPHGEPVFRRSDILVVVGNPEALREVGQQLDRPGPNERTSLRGAAAAAGPGAEFIDSHLDRLAVLAFARGFRFG